MFSDVSPEALARLEEALDAATQTLTRQNANLWRSDEGRGVNFALTLWPNLAARASTVEEMSVESFAALIRLTMRGQKESLPLFSAGHFGPMRSARGSLRTGANLQDVTCIVGDHDAGTMQPGEAARRLGAQGFRTLIYTTSSHTPETPRWRVLAPLSRPMSPQGYRHHADRLDAALGGSVLAPESRKPEQAWYFGGVSGKPDPETIIVPGEVMIDEAEDPEGAADGGEDLAALVPATTSPLGLTADLARVASAVAFIPNAGPPDWEAWNHSLMALFAATHGSEEGREVARAWSAKNPAHDDATFDMRWDHFHTSPPTRGGAGTVFHLARQHGWTDPRHDAPPDTGGDLSNARRLAERMAGRFLFDNTANRWMRFDEVRWADDRPAARREAMAVADVRVREALASLAACRT